MTGKQPEGSNPNIPAPIKVHSRSGYDLASLATLFLRRGNYFRPIPMIFRTVQLVLCSFCYRLTHFVLRCCLHAAFVRELPRTIIEKAVF